ncbi:erythroblast NAD(P)(+)--arginine ADP-ribosyltransferase-like [Ammospiza maritima maritima]
MAPLAQTLALLAMAMATTAVDVIPLDMAPDSFDDQYRGCVPAMKAALPALNHSEFKQNEKFAQVWVKAAAEWQSRGPPESPLTPDQATAIMAFTMDSLRSVFNDAVRVAGRSSQEYQNNFHFKTLHFLLTQALLMLRDTRGQQCHIMYCHVEGVQFKAEPGDFVRFGQFMSASRMERIHWYSGNDTVFHVYTCHGTEIQLFSHYPGEVLIPPFETFKVINVSSIGKGRKIQLRSNGTSSNYNCEWLQGPVGVSSGPPSTSEDSSWPPQPWQWPLGSSEPRDHHGLQGHCGYCGHPDHQDHQDPQRNEATKATVATTATLAIMVTITKVTVATMIT